jgi:hypothetical protein
MRMKSLRWAGKMREKRIAASRRACFGCRDAFLDDPAKAGASSTGSGWAVHPLKPCRIGEYRGVCDRDGDPGLAS